MTDKQKEEVTPDQLMNNFKGSSLKTIIIYTVIIHLVLLVGTSFPYLYKSIVGEDSSALSEKDRADAALRDATTALRDISEQYGLKPQDLSSRLAGESTGAPKAPKEESETKEDSTEPQPESTPDTEPDAEEPKSAIEKELETKETGPELPKPIEDEEDLFK
jgi:hypothetical protein